MKNSIEVNLRDFQIAMIDGAKSGYNTVTAEGKLSNISAMVMVGYLSAAATAFDSVGDEYHGALFDKTARRIQANWKEFMDAMQILFQTVVIEEEDPDN